MGNKIFADEKVGINVLSLTHLWLKTAKVQTDLHPVESCQSRKHDHDDDAVRIAEEMIIVRVKGLETLEFPELMSPTSEKVFEQINKWKKANYISENLSLFQRIPAAQASQQAGYRIMWCVSGYRLRSKKTKTLQVDSYMQMGLILRISVYISRMLLALSSVCVYLNSVLQTKLINTAI